MVDTITVRGKPLKLKGKLLKVGDKAPDCVLTNSELEDVSLSSFDGKELLIMTLPSLDTPVCSKEAHHFNQELGRFGKDLVTLAITMDLPFAQKRWCAAEDVEHIITLSDYKKRDLGEKFGVLIPDLGLLARTIVLLDAERNVLYTQVVNEMTDEPDYEEVFDELTKRGR